MTLSIGLGSTSFGKELYAYSPRIDFSTGGSGDERTALDFTSPHSHYFCEVNVSLDTGSWADNDLIAVIYRANGQIIFQAKWGVNATTLGQPITIPVQIILPPDTRFKAVLAMSSGTGMIGTGSVILVGRELG